MQSLKMSIGSDIPVNNKYLEADSPVPARPEDMFPSKPVEVFPTKFDKAYSVNTDGYINLNFSRPSRVKYNKTSTSKVKNSKLSAIKRQFENILKFFDLPMQENVFENVYAIISYFDQNTAREEVSMKLAKIVFDNYDTIKKGWLDNIETKKFCRDLLYMCGHCNLPDSKCI